MARPLFRLQLYGGAILVALTATSAGAQSTSFSTGKAHWLGSRYPQALPPLKAARVEPNGRNAEVDYMLGTSGCRIAAQRRWGARVESGVLGPPGAVLAADRGGILVACGSGGLHLTEIQRAGGKRLSPAAFLAGYSLGPGTRLG